jgi:hypothetical protein
MMELALAAFAFFVIIGVVRWNQQLARRRVEATLNRPGDITGTLLARHLPALVAKAQTFIRQDYGTVGLSPEFDGEIRYFIEQVILADPDYMRAARAAMAIDPTAQTRLLGPAPSQIVQMVRGAIAGAIVDPAEASQVDAIAKKSFLDGKPEMARGSHAGSFRPTVGHRDPPCERRDALPRVWRMRRRFGA